MIRLNPRQPEAILQRQTPIARSDIKRVLPDFDLQDAYWLSSLGLTPRALSREEEAMDDLAKAQQNRGGRRPLKASLVAFEFTATMQ